MPKRNAMMAWLETLDEDTLAELLRLRPDAAEPPPRALTTLTDRLSRPESVRVAVQHLNRTDVDVLAAAQKLDQAPSVSAVLSLVGTDVHRAVVEDAVARLARVGLAWPGQGDAFTLAPPLRGVGSASLRLGRPLRSLVAELTDAQLDDLVHRLDIEGPENLEQAAVAITATLTDEARVLAIAAGLPADAAALLDELVWHEPVMRTVRHPWEDDDNWGTPEQHALLDAGLVLPNGPAVVELPREVALALRGDGAGVTLHLQPPEPRVVEVDTAGVDAAAGAAATPTVYGVAQLIDLCSTAPLVALRTGGVGVKELRRAAKALATDEKRVRLWLTLAYHADLVDNDDGSVLPTEEADDWLAMDPAERLVPLLMTWWRLPVSPTMPGEDGKLPPALTHMSGHADLRLRHDLVGWSAEHAPGSAIADLTEVVDVLSWRHPYEHGDPEDIIGPTFVTVAEAESLGVLAGGALSSWGRALVSGADLTEPIRGALPAATGSVRLQADLTAMVAGIPTNKLGSLLDLAAEATERDTASTWRFSPASVRRALDAGYTAERLLAELAAASAHELPQPLVYLVNDVARRHGEVEVLRVGCCVRSDNTALLAEIVAHRGLAELKPRLIAPTVVASVKPTKETLAALRKNGYSPLAKGAGGVPVIERPTPMRARQRPVAPVRRSRAQQTPSADELRVLAKTLLARGSAAPVDPPTPPLHTSINRHVGHLPIPELNLLSDALDDEKPVEIVYVDQNGRRTRRVITPYDLQDNTITAWCHMRDEERNFLLTRIKSVDVPLVD